ncbi:hypothetical protein Ptr902_04628 [Pyrenophora tritici-repentis]|uniref:Uncharacterized protein n=1 Tax=Pyrenophora tritici-repentis TaxID=45151 RepID=A0A834RX88_9PLEO|nr:hypothetical protein PtrM4_090480 [Pyrenophora tritici-repentis]KAI0580486.1 hypothetical protein Alg215_05206 [Pyrenophora tritici-repentis]KAI0585695.1 hypothetical protein Alg130_04636 [Pyrenophora tritici-repentis]KAI0611268.1 hypothetical protein TUN205_04506 [Pyrenophora tritici-repentis]KAI2485688.1 hypothetical protein Ptr902_04628 [Pyrenophora tritici-repentis]
MSSGAPATDFPITDTTSESSSSPLAATLKKPRKISRIADRPAKVGEKDSSLKIKIELDLEVEVEIYARVKGDVTIGLM